MTTQHYLRQPTVHRLPQLIEELKTGALRIPPFQRDFVWDGEQRLHLFDSVAKGLPLGSLMIWRTTMQLPTDPHLGPIELNHQELPVGSMRQYLLDGRQRLTTLFAALAPGLWTRAEQDPPPGFNEQAPDGTHWAVAYDLDKEVFVLSNEDRPNLPMSILLDDFTLDDWLTTHAANNRSWYRRARALKSALYDYLIPVTPLYTDDLAAVTLTFKRVNRAGTTMGDLEMARALSWTVRGFDLTNEIDSMIDTLSPLGWRGLDPDTVLKVLAAAGGQGPSEMNVERLATELRANNSSLQQVGSALDWTVKFLNSMGIAGPQALPWRVLLVAIARIYLELGELDSVRRQRMQGWIAAACLTEAFGSAPPHVLRAMHKELIQYINQGAKRKPRSARRCRRFSMAWARSRVTAVTLSTLNPRKGDGAFMFENSQRAVGRSGNDVMLQLFSSGAGFSTAVARSIETLPPTLRRSAANRVLCKPEELVGLRQALEEQHAGVCASHAAPQQAISNVAQWLSQRDDMIREAEIAWLKEQGDGDARVTWQNEPALMNIR